MSINPNFNYPEGELFNAFLSNLRLQKDAEWEELISHFRSKVIPYLRKKVGSFSSGSVVSADYFVEEVYAASIVKFYELFETGTFENTGHLRGLMFRITDNQLLAHYKKKKRDGLISFSENIENEGFEDSIEEDYKRQGVIKNVKEAMAKLPDGDRQILHHFSVGGKLKDIAEEMNISEASCRKKKQRAMDKLRLLLKPLLTILIFFTEILRL